ncbi:MAG: hypothetical protein Kow006_24140 [Gammaproteobacteria bacterium]
MDNEISAHITALVSRSAETASKPARVNEAASVERQLLPKEPPSKTGAPVPLDEEDLNRAVSRIQDFVQSIRRELQFSVEEESGRTVIRVIDSETDKVIRQIPPEEVIAVSNQLREMSEGILLRVQA